MSSASETYYQLIAQLHPSLGPDRIQWALPLSRMLPRTGEMDVITAQIVRFILIAIRIQIVGCLVDAVALIHKRVFGRGHSAFS